jgi:multidrug efflux system outer membrane protein
MSPGRQSHVHLRLAATFSFSLANLRYRGGIDSFLASLDAQRASYAAQRTLLATQLIEASNRVALYRALGGETVDERRPDGLP